jgi:hypothetical protein
MDDEETAVYLAFHQSWMAEESSMRVRDSRHWEEKWMKANSQPSSNGSDVRGAGMEWKMH